MLAFETRLAEASLPPVRAAQAGKPLPLRQHRRRRQGHAELPGTKFFKAQGVERRQGLLAVAAEVLRRSSTRCWPTCRPRSGRPTCASTPSTMPRRTCQQRLRRRELRRSTARRCAARRNRSRAGSACSDAINGEHGHGARPALRRGRRSRPKSKARAEELVDNLRAALKARIEKLDWMSAETKTEGAREVGHVHAEDRLSGQVARLVAA